MASAIRSKLSARKAKAVLFIVQAEDEIVNPRTELRREEVRKSVGEQAPWTSKHEHDWPSPRLWDV